MLFPSCKIPLPWVMEAESKKFRLVQSSVQFLSATIGTGLTHFQIRYHNAYHPRFS